MNPQYMNQPPGPGYNPAYRMAAPTPGSMGYGAPPGTGNPGPGYGGNAPNNMGAPPGNMYAPPPGNMGPPPNSMGPTSNSLGPSPGGMGPPPNSMSPPPNSMGPPPSSLGAQPNNVGPPANSMGPTPGVARSMATTNGFNSTGAQRPIGPPGTYGHPSGKLMGQPPMNNFGPRPGPPMSNGPATAPSDSTAGVAPGPPTSQMNSAPNNFGISPPPGPGGAPTAMNANQLSSQMGGMNINQGMPPPTSIPQSNFPGSGNYQPPSSVGAPPMPGSTAPFAGPPPMGPGGLPGAQVAGQPPRPGFPQRTAAGPPPMGGVPPPSSISGGQGQMSGPGYTSGFPPTSAVQPNAPAPLPLGGQVPNQGMMAGPPPSPGGMYPGAQPQGYQPAPRPGMPTAAPQPPPSQPRRLDPDQMPSPIQVIEDDRKSRSGEFSTAQRGSVPPLVTSDFMVVDRGNASPRLLRSSMYNIPCTNDMMKQSHIPFVMAISPFARLGPGEQPLPIVDLGEIGPVRCNRCKAYMNPYMQFIDGGRRFLCCFCGCATDVPAEYFAHLDHTGRRVDCYDRPELCYGSYEFVATKDYCKNNTLPKPPAYIFMIDVSYNAVKSGLVQLICQHLKEDILVNLPKELGKEESQIRVGFVTYAKELHFYNVKGNLAQPQMLVVSDIQDVFVPLLDGFLVTLAESEIVIDSLLAQLPQTFNESRETETVLGPVIEAGLDALKAAECAGKLFIFHTSLPMADAPGKLKNRDDRKLLGTDKEKTILSPQNNYYTKLGQSCVAAGCGVDLFLFPNSYIDIASIAEVPRITGGNVYKYSYFQADLDGPRLIEDLRNNVMKPIGFDCIMRVRTSTGIRPVDFLGNFYMANTTDVELANMDCDKTVTLEIKHDDKLSESEGAYIQAAMLYTSVSGQRRLRVLNMSFNCCTQMGDLFRNCELDTLINYLAKLSIRESLNSNPKSVRENIMNRCAQILSCYRKNCASPSSAGQLILPECMKLLPLYSNCIIKSQVHQGAAEVTTDDRSYLIHAVNAMSVKDSHVFFYPRLIPLHELDPGIEDPEIPVAIRCSYERLKDSGIYMIENGLAMWMWIGLNVPTEWVVGLFGVQSAAQIDIDQTRLQELDTSRSRQIRGIVSKVRQERFKHMKLVIVRQRDKLEPVFQQHLVEDRSVGGSASYVDFLCHIHREIRTLLS